MTIRIESFTVENLRCFKGEQTLNFEETGKANFDVISGANGTGKTTLANATRLCLTGSVESDQPLLPHELGDQSPNTDVSGEISVVISDRDLGRRFRFSRQFRTAEKRRGPVNAVDSLRVAEDTDGSWTRVSSSNAVNAVFPRPAFTFCKLDSKSPIAINNAKNGISWSELVADLGDAAAQQSAARGVDLPAYFSNNYELGDELLGRINHRLESIGRQYRVEERQDGLVARSEKYRSVGGGPALATGDRLLISQLAVLVAGELLPETPPLIGDSMFGRFSAPLRQDIVRVIQDIDRQTLLFATNVELEDLDIQPRFELVLNQEKMHCHTVSLE